MPCATALGYPRQVVGRWHEGWGWLAALDPQHLSQRTPRLQRGPSWAGGLADGFGKAVPWGRHARSARGAGCREERGWGGGAGACALRPCHIGMSRSAERRRCRRRLRRSAGGGGRGELPAAPLRQAQQEGGRERADASGASEKSARAGKREEGKKESEREREESERLRSARAKTPGR